MIRPTMIYGTRRAGEALARAIRHFRHSPGSGERYVALPRACGDGFEVVWFPGGPAIPYHGVGLVIDPNPIEHEMAVRYMQMGRSIHGDQRRLHDEDGRKGD